LGGSDYGPSVPRKGGKVDGPVEERSGVSLILCRGGGGGGGGGEGGVGGGGGGGGGVCGGCGGGWF